MDFPVEKPFRLVKYVDTVFYFNPPETFFKGDKTGSILNGKTGNLAKRC